ncbi:MAG: SurA N-terminal domain-containing protein [Patescibacteria group bacterium]
MDNQQETPKDITKNSQNKGWQSWLTLKTAIPICILLIVLAALYYFKGVFIAATVNGSPISRMSVIKDLEKQGGKQAVDALITKKLIDNEIDKKGITVSQEEMDEEIKSIESGLTAQGTTLDLALQQQGISREKLNEQISFQKKLEKLLADKTVVSDQEVDAYIKDNNVKPQAGEKIEDIKAEIKTTLQQEKFNQVAQQWIEQLKTNANIKYYVNY